MRRALCVLACLLALSARARGSVPVFVNGNPFATVDGVETCDARINRLDCVATYDGDTTPTPALTPTRTPRPTPTPYDCQRGQHWNISGCPAHAAIGPCLCVPDGTPTPVKTATPTPRGTSTPGQHLSRVYATDEGWQRCLRADVSRDTFGFDEAAIMPLSVLAGRAGGPKCAPRVLPSLFTTWAKDTDARTAQRARSNALAALNSYPEQLDGFFVGEEPFAVWSYGLATGAFSLTRESSRTGTIEVPVTRDVRRCFISGKPRTRRCVVEHRPVVSCRFDRVTRRRICVPRTRLETRTVTERRQIPGAELPDPLAVNYGDPTVTAGFALQATLIREICAYHECLAIPYLGAWTSDGRWDDDSPLLDTVVPAWADGWLRALRAQYPPIRVAWQISNCSRPTWTEERLRFLGAWLAIVNVANGLVPELQIEACKDRSFERPGGGIRYDFPPLADCAALEAAEQVQGTRVRVWPDIAAASDSFRDQLALCPPRES